jgi:hypothetical protein
MVRVASTWVWDVRGETHVKWVTFVLSTWWIHTTNRLLSQLIVRAMRGETHVKWVTFVLSTWWIHTTNRLLSQLIVRAMHLKRATFQVDCTGNAPEKGYFPS